VLVDAAPQYRILQYVASVGNIDIADILVFIQQSAFVLLSYTLKHGFEHDILIESATVLRSSHAIMAVFELASVSCMYICK
jgi:hypothetical protein